MNSSGRLNHLCGIIRHTLVRFKATGGGVYTLRPIMPAATPTAATATAAFAGV